MELEPDPMGLRFLSAVLIKIPMLYNPLKKAASSYG